MRYFDYRPEAKWRLKQKKRLAQARISKLKARLSFLFFNFFLILIFFSFLSGIFYYTQKFFFKDKAEVKKEEIEKTDKELPFFSDLDLQEKLKTLRLDSYLKSKTQVKIDNKPYTAFTSIKPCLQDYLVRLVMQAQKAGRGKPELLALLVMDAEKGSILAASGSHGDEIRPDIVLSLHPAASLFKIPSAAAAIDLCTFKPDTRLFFNGGMYTLYKRQMGQEKHRHTNYISFEDAFAKSVNPVFGKIGYHDLKKTALEDYARIFGFGQSFHGNFPSPESSIEIDETPYNWAEIASGFNRRTLISPVHGALMASIIAADGFMPPISIIEKLIDDDKELRYEKSELIRKQVLNKNTSEKMQVLMERTTTNGTASKVFKDKNKNRVLSPLKIGSKTGSISNVKRDIRYDWFVGYAINKEREKIALAVMVGHKDYMGKRAGEYAREIFYFYFNE